MRLCLLNSSLLKFVMLHAIFNRKELLPPDDALQKQKANSLQTEAVLMYYLTRRAKNCFLPVAATSISAFVPVAEAAMFS